MTVDLIRNRPVFDKDALKPGVAVKHKNKNGNYYSQKEWRNGIIVGFELNNLEIATYDGEDDLEIVEIHIDEVISEDVSIQILK